jgi:hypothetical protein
VEKYKAILSFAKRSRNIGFVSDCEIFIRRLLYKFDECGVIRGKSADLIKRKEGSGTED